MTTPRIVCISHGEDADGLTSAALIKRVKNADIILATYDDLPEALESIQEPTDELYITDLNLREAVIPEVIRIASFCNVTLIDHHPAGKGTLKKIEDAGVRVIHSPKDCAAVLVYNHFREELGREPGRLAAYASWADQFEDGPIAEQLLNEYDRQTVQAEGLMLAFAITRTQKSDFRMRVMYELTDLAFPHRIQGVPEASREHMEDMAKTIEEIPKQATIYGNLAYLMVKDEIPIGTVANLITDALGVRVGLCYRQKSEDMVNISIRSRRGFNYHLGDITRRIAREKGGYGGGHKRASGASLSLSSIDDFIMELEKEID
jgi:single-stranded DNA-specific DHH superfamily exonuclease